MIGSVKRVDDPRLLRGIGQFVGDISLPGQLEAAFLRSPHAHARLLSVDLSSALAMPSVAAARNGAEAMTLARPQRAQLRLAGFKSSDLPCLATEKVRCVGQAVAAVVAETRYQAEDALDLIEAQYEALPAV